MSRDSAEWNNVTRIEIQNTIEQNLEWLGSIQFKISDGVRVSPECDTYNRKIHVHTHIAEFQFLKEYLDFPETNISKRSMLIYL